MNDSGPVRMYGSWRPDGRGWEIYSILLCMLWREGRNPDTGLCGMLSTLDIDDQAVFWPVKINMRAEHLDRQTFRSPGYRNCFESTPTESSVTLVK